MIGALPLAEIKLDKENLSSSRKVGKVFQKAD
jgi:hypothetical protein